ncbi:MAG TPA: stage II sporulation protein E, partial [Oscillospiraceae bacterium]|nr:stage II sporulation protein E [Oscillospiraceae bacterium]
MDKPTILPYRRNYVELESVQKVNENKTNLLQRINIKTILLHIVAFLLGRAGILHGLTPFGIAFFTALSQKDRKFGIIGITIFLGIVTMQGLSSSIPYGFAILIIYCLFQYVLDLRNIKIFKTSLIGAAAYLFTTALFLSFGGFYLYDWIIVGFESVVIFIVVYISHYAIPVVLQNTNRKILSTEEIICIAIITALALSGINEIYILGLSLRNILGILITILFAYNGGAGVGASVGITLGLITSMSTGSTPVIIGIFGFSGLLAGVFKDIGRAGSAFGFLIGNAILTFYVNGYYEIFIQFKECIAAFVLFLVFPKTLIIQMEKFCNTRATFLNSGRTHSDRMRQLTYQKLKEYATTFGELSATFEKISEKHEFYDKEDMSKLIEKVANRACYNCSMKRSCWDQNFNVTYQGILDMFIYIEEKGILKYDNLPKTMKRRCMRPEAVVENVAHLYEFSHLNTIWKQRLMESRGLVGDQLGGVAKILGELATDINNELEFDIDLEDAVHVALDKTGLSVKDITVSNSAEGNLEIVIDKKPYFNRDKDKLISIVSEAVGTKLVSKTRNYDAEDKEGCSLTLVEAERYAALTRSAAATGIEGELSGDSYTFVNLKNGQYMAALSDGMGTGDKAHRQSGNTIDMLEKMMEAGFQRDIAIKTINSILMLKSSDEMFASLDMALIDLHKGTADFVKIGSAPSFIKRHNGKIEIITASTLPIGILTDIQIEGNVQNLEDGDLIITVSDGITDSDKEKREKWLIQYL